MTIAPRRTRDRDRVQGRGDDDRAPSAHARARPRLDPLARRQPSRPFAGALLQHRRDPERRPQAERVGHPPVAARQQRGGPDDRQAAARRRGRRRAQIGVEHLVQEDVAAVEREGARVVGPRLLLQAAMGLHERREAAQLRPPHEQLGRAALDAPTSEVAADVVRPVREARRRRRHGGGDQRAQRPEVRGLVACPQVPDGLLAAPPAAPEDDAGAAAVGLVERALHRPPVEQPVAPAACAPRVASARRRSSPR